MTWIFGYGSLAYRPGFEFKRCVRGYILGYRRVFWQGSTDHRGTQEAPGRTVTLHEDEHAVTWGVAYELAGSAEQQRQTIAYLEEREKQYDVRRRCAVYGQGGPQGSLQGPSEQQQQQHLQEQQLQQGDGGLQQLLVPEALVYIATDSPGNANWLGPAPLAAIAAQVAASSGPSGPNRDYVLRLAEAMREMGVEDEELFELEALVRRCIDAGGADERLVLLARQRRPLPERAEPQRRRSADEGSSKAGAAGAGASAAVISVSVVAGAGLDAPRAPAEGGEQAA